MYFFVIYTVYMNLKLFIHRSRSLYNTILASINSENLFFARTFLLKIIRKSNKLLLILFFFSSPSLKITVLFYLIVARSNSMRLKDLTMQLKQREQHDVRAFG